MLAKQIALIKLSEAKKSQTDFSFSNVAVVILYTQLVHTIRAIDEEMINK